MKLHFSRWPTRHDAQRALSNYTLLFLHGLGGTGQIWRPIAAELEENFDCLAPDQRGHGKSRPVPENEKNKFHALDYALDVKLLLENQAMTPKIKPCVIIGHSMGVRTALALTQVLAQGSQQQIVKGLIALDLGISEQWGGGMGITLGRFLEKLPETFSTREALKKYLTEHCPDTSIAQYLGAVAKSSRDETKNESSGAAEMWSFPFDHDSLVQTIHQAHQAPLKDWVRTIQAAKIPLLFLQGRNSKVWSVPDYEKQKAELENPLTTFESWEDAGHGLPFEQRKKFIERVRAFILTL